MFQKIKPSPEQENKEKIQLTGEDFAAQNPYYASIARGYHLAQMILFGLLAGFVILSMLIRSDDITYENLFYLFKDIHAAVDSDDVSFSTLVYDADEIQDFAPHRDGLAVVGESGLTVFSATGRQTLVQPLNMKTPYLLSSSRCLLVWEQGGHDFSLYNAFVRIHAGKTQGEIICAAISDSGWFALAEQSGSSSTISVYNKHSNLKAEHFKDALTTALAINDAGDILAVVTTVASGGTYQTKVEMYRTGTDQVLQQWELSDAFPIACSFADDKTLYLTTTDRMLVLKKNGETAVDVLYEQDIDRAFYTDLGYALLFHNGTLSLYDKEGTVIGHRADSQNIRNVLIGRQMIYMITDHALIEYNIETGNGAQTEYDFPIQDLLWYAEDELLLCSRSSARYIKIK